MTMTDGKIFDFVARYSDECADCYGVESVEYQVAMSAANYYIYRELNGDCNNSIADIAAYWADIMSGGDQDDYLTESCIYAAQTAVEDFFEFF